MDKLVSLSRGAAALIALLACPALGHATPAFFVQASGNLLTEADNPDDPTHNPLIDQQLFNSGALSQLSFSTGTISSSSQGSLHSNGQPFLVQSDASFSGTASIGALHGVLIASANNKGFSGLVGTFGQGDFVVKWSDTVFFQTSRPGGSDFTVSLTLDDLIGFSNVFKNNSESFESGAAVARVQLNGGFILPAIQDTVNGDVVIHPPSFTQSTTIHAVNGEAVTFSGSLELIGKVQDEISSVKIDASDTALFNLFSNDPDASYTTASGVSFLPVVTTAAPEPATLGLFGIGLAGLGVIRRRRAG